MTTNRFVEDVILDKKYWCLFCGEDGVTWDTVDELFAHMETTVHRTPNGGLVIPRGKVNEN